MITTITEFSPAVIKSLRYYVYRLIDPRNGETFYVGKGIGNRVFAHVAGEASVVEGDADDELSEKLTRIREIRNAGLEVIHVIHRHGMEEHPKFRSSAPILTSSRVPSGPQINDLGL